MSTIIQARFPRPRGFINYSPRADAAALIDAVNSILDEYADHLPLTLRQIFYLLVTRELIAKTEKGYKNQLCETMNKARRAQLIPMDAIRDDGFRMDSAPGWPSEESLINTFHNTVDQFTLDRQIGQERRLVVWCEAAGMVPQLERVAHRYSVRVASSGGFDSLTSKHHIGETLAVEPTTVLHLGDHDPSGIHIFGSLDEDITAFCDAYEGDVEFVRLAVTPDQVAEHDLPTAPPKPTDKRAFSGQTTQCEALPPDVLAETLEAAITRRMDLDILADIKAQEDDSRERLIEMLEGFGDD